MNKSKLVFSPKIARFLIKNGMQVIDIKPDKFDKEKTIFVFEESEQYHNLIDLYKNQKGETVNE